MKSYETRTTQLTVAPAGEPLFSEMATEIRIEDEAAGEFVVVEQRGNNLGKIHINPEEWAQIAGAVDELLKNCRPEGDFPSRNVPVQPPPALTDPSLPPLDPIAPRRKMLIEIEVAADFERRLDNQQMVEREIHADRWLWEWKS